MGFEQQRIINKHIIKWERRARMIDNLGYAWLDIPFNEESRSVMKNNQLFIERNSLFIENYPFGSLLEDSSMLGMARKCISGQSPSFWDETNSVVYKICSSADYIIFGLPEDIRFKIICI